MLLILMYHRIYEANQPARLLAFTAHLQKLLVRYPIVLPGEVTEQPLSICLTFDDAYYDFYHYVYPILLSLHIPAVLAVPVKFILDDTSCDAKQRLRVPYELAMQDECYQQQAPFCTWRELNEMTAQHRIELASHSYSHQNLQKDVSNARQEVLGSQQILQEKTKKTARTFVYPYGAMNSDLQKMVCEHYSFSFRIGTAMNQHWQQPTRLYYRVDAEKFWQQGNVPTAFDLWRYRANYYLNRLRGK